MNANEFDFYIYCTDQSRKPMAEQIKSIFDVAIVCDLDNEQKRGKRFINSTPNRLAFTENGIFFESREGKNTMQVRVDFSEGKAAHRRRYGGGKGQAIAKAVGLNKGFIPHVMDCTAGLGGDAFVLASLGCTVTMFERSPIAHLLLSDGLTRALGSAKDSGDEALLKVVTRLRLSQGDAVNHLEVLLRAKERIDVIYLDPMFPERKKSASVKKEMHVFHSVIGADEDADKLLAPALACARYRVVVKRPKIAPFLAAREPSFQLLGKSSRYDIYTILGFPSADKTQES